MSAFENRLSKSIFELRDQYEASTSLVAAFVGSVIGTFVALAVVVIAGMLIGRTFSWVTFALGVIVSIASLDTIFELVFAMFMCKQTTVDLPRHIAPYIIGSKVVELVFFVVAALMLLRVF